MTDREFERSNEMARRLGHMKGVAEIAAMDLRGVLRAMAGACPPDRAQLSEWLGRIAGELEAASSPTSREGGER
jgi:hypothetical protein